MKISTKGRYGLRAMVDLAANSKGEYIPLSDIAKRQDVSENYLEQVFGTLRKTGLVKSIKGAQGGYTISDNPSRITVGSILRALEGELSVVDDLEAQKKSGNIIEQCISEKVWESINKSINGIVDTITLEDLTEEFLRIKNSNEFMFYI